MKAPYAVLVMVVALTCGFYPAVIVGLSPWLSLALGALVLTGFLFYYGRRTPAADTGATPQAHEHDMKAAAAWYGELFGW